MVWLEYSRVITGLSCLFLGVRQHKAMWVVGFLISLVYVFVFLFAEIYADMGLRTYYVGISIYSFYQWTRKKHEIHTENDSLPSDHILYTHLGLPLFMGIIGTLVAIFATLWYLLYQFTGSPIPVGGALTTSVDIVAIWMLAGRIIEHWIFWVIVNPVSIYLHYLRGLHPTMLLYLCYVTLAIIGYYNWRRGGEEF